MLLLPLLLPPPPPLLLPPPPPLLHVHEKDDNKLFSPKLMPKP